MPSVVGPSEEIGAQLGLKVCSPRRSLAKTAHGPLFSVSDLAVEPRVCQQCSPSFVPGTTRENPDIALVAGVNAVSKFFRVGTSSRSLHAAQLARGPTCDVLAAAQVGT